MSCLFACLSSFFIFHLSYMSSLFTMSSLLSSSCIIIHLVIFHTSFVIKFEVWCYIPFSNNEACCIQLTLVLIDFALSFCFINCFINVLLGLMCISVLSALCIVISQYLSSVQWVIYCKSMTFIMLSMKSS